MELLRVVIASGESWEGVKWIMKENQHTCWYLSLSVWSVGVLAFVMQNPGKGSPPPPTNSVLADSLCFAGIYLKNI